jgi:hypothetical protein
VSGVHRTIDPPPPLHPAEDARHWIGLLQYNLSTTHSQVIILCFNLAIDAESELAGRTLSHIVVPVDHGWALAQTPATFLKSAHIREVRKTYVR